MPARKPCTDKGEGLVEIPETMWVVSEGPFPLLDGLWHFISEFPYGAVIICFACSNFCFFLTCAVELYYPLQTNEFCL